MSEIEETFTELFFGSGMILGLLIYLTIIGLSALRVKYLGILYIPLSCLLVLEYLERASDTNNCFWGAIIMMVSIPFLFWNLWKGKADI